MSINVLTADRLRGGQREAMLLQEEDKATKETTAARPTVPRSG